MSELESPKLKMAGKSQGFESEVAANGVGRRSKAVRRMANLMKLSRGGDSMEAE